MGVFPCHSVAAKKYQDLESEQTETIRQARLIFF